MSPIKEETVLLCDSKELFWNVLCKFLIKIESTWRSEVKEQASQLTLLYCGEAVRSSHWRCSEGLQLYLKKPPTQVFSCEYCKMFKTTYFEKHLQTAAF